jgi:hypothetical protein
MWPNANGNQPHHPYYWAIFSRIFRGEIVAGIKNAKVLMKEFPHEESEKGDIKTTMFMWLQKEKKVVPLIIFKKMTRLCDVKKIVLKNHSLTPVKRFETKGKEYVELEESSSVEA